MQEMHMVLVEKIGEASVPLTASDSDNVVKRGKTTRTCASHEKTDAHASSSATL